MLFGITKVLQQSVVQEHLNTWCYTAIPMNKRVAAATDDAVLYTMHPKQNIITLFISTRFISQFLLPIFYVNIRILKNNNEISQLVYIEYFFNQCRSCNANAVNSHFPYTPVLTELSRRIGFLSYITSSREKS